MFTKDTLIPVDVNIKGRKYGLMELFFTYAIACFYPVDLKVLVFSFTIFTMQLFAALPSPPERESQELFDVRCYLRVSA